MSGEQNHGKNWDADVMIENAKSLQRVVKEAEIRRNIGLLGLKEAPFVGMQQIRFSTFNARNDCDRKKGAMPMLIESLKGS